MELFVLYFLPWIKTENDTDPHPPPSKKANFKKVHIITCQIVYNACLANSLSTGHQKTSCPLNINDLPLEHVSQKSQKFMALESYCYLYSR